jgi:hypothetical protein
VSRPLAVAVAERLRDIQGYAVFNNTDGHTIIKALPALARLVEAWSVCGQHCQCFTGECPGEAALREVAAALGVTE